MKKIFVLFFIIVFALSSEIIRFPSEVLDVNRIRMLENQYQNQLFSAEEILSKVDQELGRYFQQFQKERLLKETISSIPYDYYKFPLNQVYLLLYVRNLKDIEKSQKIFSPILYNTFVFKGKLHQDLDQNNLALYSYLQALNYTIPIFEKQVLKKEIPDKVKILELENILFQQELLNVFDYFEYLDLTLGNENFLKEIENNDLKNQIQIFKEKFTEMKKLIENLKRIKINYYQAILENSNEKNVFQNEFDNKWNDFYQNYENLWNIESNLKKFINVFKNQYSEILYKMAIILKEIELRQKDRERILNQSSYYRGTGNQLGVNKTLHRNLIGYTRLLELAVRLNPEKLEYLDLLSDQYFQEKNIQAGILLEKDWISRALENDNRNPKHYLRLISYYIQSYNVSLAKEYLEKLFVILEKNPNLQKEIFENPLQQENLILSNYDHFLFFYADFMLKNNFSNKEEIFLDLLNKIDKKIQELENKNIQAYREEVFKNKILIALVNIYKNEKNNSRELEVLQAIDLQFRKLEDKIQELKNLKKQKELEALEIKQQLLYEENEEKSQRLFELQRIQIPDLEQKIDNFQTTLNGIPIGSTLERMAYLYFLKKDLENSLNYYNALKNNPLSNQEQKKRALQNIIILQDILTKKLWKKIEVPDNF